jgi:hypothetical protein
MRPKAGTACALVAIAPAIASRGGHVAVVSMAGWVATILATGLATATVATALMIRLPLISRLCSERSSLEIQQRVRGRRLPVHRQYHGQVASSRELRHLNVHLKHAREGHAGELYDGRQVVHRHLHL